MVESFLHKELKMQGKQLLLKKGFVKNQIEVDTHWFSEELNGQEFKFRVDVYGGNGKKMAVECGNFPRWKHAYYEKFFGRENVIHLAYPKTYGKYLAVDINENSLNPSQAKQFLIDTYKKYVYEEFKNDEVYSFLELKNDNEDLFDLNHNTYQEINPDWGNQEKVEGHKIWMNFPTEMTLSKKEFREEIHIGMIYHAKDIFILVILFSGKEPCKKFLKLSKQHHEKIFQELKRLPSGFKTRKGFSFWEKNHPPPLDKEWDNPIACHDLTKEDYEEILEDQGNLVNMGFLKRGPALDLVKIYINKEEIPETLEKLKPLYKLLIKPQSIVDDLAIKIKNSGLNWKWRIEERQTKELYLNYIEENGNIEESNFRKACKILKKDPEFLEYIR